MNIHLNTDQNQIYIPLYTTVAQSILRASTTWSLGCFTAPDSSCISYRSNGQTIAGALTDLATIQRAIAPPTPISANARYLPYHGQ